MYKLYYDTELLQKYGGMFVEHTSVEADKELQTNPNIMLIYIAHASHHHGKFECGSDSIELFDNDILLINPNTEFKLYSFNFAKDKKAKGDNAIGVYSCSFLPDYLPLKLSKLKNDFPDISDFLIGKIPYIYTHDTNELFIRNMIVRIIDDFAYNQPAFEYTVKYFLPVILINIFRIYSASKNMSIAANSNMVIGQIENYIQKNIHSKVSLSELAKIHNITPRHLCRLFKKHTGMTFTEFANRMRAEKLKDELENVDRPLYLIYEDFDFSPQHLNHIFKDYTGYSMSEYKAKFNYKVDNPLFRSR